MSVSSIPSEIIVQLHENSNDDARIDLICSFLSQSSPIKIGNLDSEIESIICNCLKDENDPKIKRILAALTTYTQNNSMSKMSKLRKTAGAIAKIAPMSYLNAASPDPDGSAGFGFGVPHLKNCPLSKISSRTFVDWCSDNDARWGRVIPYLEVFIPDQTEDEDNNKEKLSPLINEILEISPQPGVVVRAIINYANDENTAGPIIGYDSFGRARMRRLRVLKELENHSCEEIQFVISNSIILKNAGV